MDPIVLITGWGVPAKLAKPLLYGLGILLLVGAVWLSIHLWGNHRYDEGVSAEDAKWQSAVEQLKSDASNSAANATTNAEKNAANFVEQHTKDQEAVNAAEANGTSPLDVLFGN